METKCEVVRVLSDHSSIDSESYEHRYRTLGPFTLGFYVVIWPPSVSAALYDGEARFMGPYRRRMDAEGVLESRPREARDRPDRTAECGHPVRQDAGNTPC